MNPDEYASSLGGVAVEDDPDAFAQSLGGIANEDDADAFARSLGADVDTASPSPSLSVSESPAQPLPETAWNSIARGFLGLATKPVQAIANTQQAAIDLAGQAPVIGPAWKKALEMLPSPARMMAPVAKDIEDRRAEMSPVDSRNPITATVAGAVPTALGMIATGGTLGVTAPLYLGAAMGAQQGFETADEIGVTSPAGKLATAGAFGLIEGVVERGIPGFGGFGASRIAGSPIKQGLKGLATETIEEPVTGVGQDITTRIAATEDPNKQGFTATGYDLAQLSPDDPRYWTKRAHETLGGAVGGTVFAGVNARQPAMPQAVASAPSSTQGPPPDGSPPTPSTTASVTPQASPVTTPAAQAEAPVTPTTDAGSIPAAGAFQFEYEGLDESGNDVRGTVQADNQEAAIATVRASGHYPTRITQSTQQSPTTDAGSSPSNQGPGAASASEYQPTTTLKDSVDRFRAIGADDPFLYRVSPEKELDDLARTVIDEDARGLQAVTDDLLTLDSNDLGLNDREHAALLGHAMWKWATQPAGEAQTANVRAIRDVLKPVGSRGGQLLQVFDYIKRLDPEFRLDETLDAAATQRTEAIQTATGGMTEAEIEAEIARRVQEEMAKMAPQTAQARTPGQRKAIKQTAQEKAAKAVMDKLKPRAPRLKSSHVNRMVKAWMDATEAGISDRADFRAAFEQAFQVPKGIPSALAADLRAKAVKARALPQGSSERLALERDIEDDLTIHSGVSTWELFKAGWYQNILSGTGFQVVNAVGSIQNMVTPIFQSIGDAAAGNPASFIALLKGAKRGLSPATAGFVNTWQTGRAYKGGEKYGDVSASELTARGWQSATPVQKAIYTGMAQGLTRRISRIGAGVDVFFNSMAREMGAQTAAARKLSAKGLRYGTPEYKAAFAKELGFDGTKWADAMAKVAADLKADGKPVTQREIKRRALETATRERDPALTGTAIRMADRLTYQQDPEGSGKIISNIIQGFQGIPVAGRLLLPFNKIVSNFFAENLDYGGVGLLRAAFGEPVTQRIARAQGKESSQPVKYETQERRERAIKGVVGLSTGLAVVAAAMANADAPDDDDNAFMIYGAGPKSKTERDAWTEAGNKPFSIRVKGRVIPFTETIFAVPLAVAGTYMDAQRYGTLKNHPTAAARLMFGSLKSMEAVANFGPLASVKKGLDMMQGRVSSTNSMVSMSGVKGAVPAAALLRDIEQIMDPKKVDDSTLAGAILGDIPGLSAYQDLKLNRFGEPADDVGLPGLRRIIGTTKKPEPVIKFMLKHDITMPGAADVTRVAEDMTFPNDPALDMDRISKLHLTRNEDRAFKQESGKFLKDGLTRTMKEIEAGEAAGRVYPTEAIQKRIQQIDRAAEISAKRKLMGR